ncbi:PEP/pyruvate-binding domain-containing protein [Patulibacter sp.]|uniref:PEP/pyruvate-binding domain-containing protein n=1 Tax=Patulibacter sp. TaxID=1912859 RepID=UPI002724CBBD|nr:PEP/pyruvate-binding domain-containing protein [Patulibacter sp.]MDO9410842.1 PEP/pyruvate-binding domain-containing protein [Patulibacter sp.]
MRGLRRDDTGTAVFPFDRSPGSRSLLGAEGAGLARLCELGLPTPPGFTISTASHRSGGPDDVLPATVWEDVRARLPGLAGDVLAEVGEAGMPLLLTVRVSAPVHMPGLLGPVVDLGMGEGTLAAVAAVAGPAFAGKRYLAFLRSFGSEVRGIPVEQIDGEAGRHADPLGAAHAVRALLDDLGDPVPDDLEDQLRETVVAARASWSSPDAVAYRDRAQLSDDHGVAVVVQAMVHGDRDLDSGRGVAFSRDPATGSPSATGTFVPHASGGDAVPGHLPLTAMRARLSTPLAELDAALPLVEASYRDMCAVDFAVQSGRLWFLRAKPAARSGPAAVRIAVDLVDDGLITTPEALARIPLSVMVRLQAPVFARDQHVEVLALGDPAAPGAVSGVVAFHPERASALAAAGADVVLILPRVRRGDARGALASVALVTSGPSVPEPEALERYARPTIFGAAAIEIDPDGRRATVSGRPLVEGDVVSVDGTTGVLMAGAVRMVPAQPDLRIARVLQWADERRSVDLVAAAPAGAVVVHGPDEVAAPVDGPAVVDVPPAADGCAIPLARTVGALMDAGASSLVLRVAVGPGIDGVRPPAGPWTAIVADRHSWAVRLLAGRIEVVGTT